MLKNIHRLLEGDRRVEIDCGAIAGRHGWSIALARFLDPDNNLCLLNKREVVIRIAMVSDDILTERDDGKKHATRGLEQLLGR